MLKIVTTIKLTIIIAVLTANCISFAGAMSEKKATTHILINTENKVAKLTLKRMRSGKYGLNYLLGIKNIR